MKFSMVKFHLAGKNEYKNIKKTKMRYLAISVFLTISYIVTIAQESNYSKNFAPTDYPDRMMMTIPGNPATSRAVSWRTVYGNSISIGEIAPADPDSKLEGKAKKTEGTFAPWEEGSTLAMGHKVVFENLQPETKYVYRVGDGKHWSEWVQFETSSDKTEKFSFLYFGDIQNDVKSYGSRILRQAYSDFPKSDFLLFVGDIVSKSNESNWREFFYAGGWMLSMVPSIATPGNHEYDSHSDRPRTFSKHWNQIYTMPDNSPSKEYNNRFYYVDYQGVRIVSVDGSALQTNVNDTSMLLNWLEKTLQENPSQWSIVITHIPMYSCSYGRKDQKYQEMLRPVIEKNGVDLVLQGHDHAYCRGQNLAATGNDCKNPPMYVVSVAGPKMYALDPNLWSDRAATRTQLYQNITVSNDTLNYESYTVSGELYDKFMLVKSENGRNRLIEPEELSAIPLRMEIPNGYEKRYTEAELKKYKAKMNSK